MFPTPIDRIVAISKQEGVLAVPAADPIQHSLRLSIKDGVAWAIMHALGERYVGPFVIQGTDSGFWRLAALAALPSLAGALVMWHAANVVDRIGQRKKLIVYGCVIQSLTWLIAAAAVFVWPDLRYWMMLLAFILYLIMHYFTAPIWTSLMGDLVPEDRRGRYYGSRNFLVGVMVVVCTFAGGVWLDHSKKIFPGTPDLFGYFVLFIVAMLARLQSSRYLSQMHDPEYHPKKDEIFSMVDFIKRMPEGNFGHFVLYQTLLTMGCSIAGAFFAWYWLDPSGLGLTMSDYAIITLCQLLTLFCTQPIIGRISDRIGNKKVIAFGGLGIALIPPLWLVSKNFYWVCAVQVYDGIVWAAFSLATWNYIFDCVSPPKRARCLAFHTFFCVGIGSTIGCFLGAALAEWPTFPVTVFGWSLGKFELLLLVSGAARLLPSLLLGTFKEMRLKPAESVPQVQTPEPSKAS